MHLTNSLTLAAAALGLWASTASAAPLTGEVSINGPDNYTQTQVNFTGPGNLQGDSGSFLVMGTCTSCVTMAASLLATSTEQLFTSTNLGHTVTLDIQAPNTFNFIANTNPALDSLDVTGAGTLILDGQSVAGAYSLTTQGPISSPPTVVDVTFSATAVPSATPEPSSVLLMGTSLIGFWVGLYYWRRHRDRHQSATPAAALA